MQVIMRTPMATIEAMLIKCAANCLLLASNSSKDRRCPR
jgi:hypothetical protein